MKITQFITRLEELRVVAGDVEVAVGSGRIQRIYESARAEVCNVTPTRDFADIGLQVWESLPDDNTEHIVHIW